MAAVMAAATVIHAWEGGSEASPYPPQSVTKDDVTGTITWGDYAYGTGSVEDNEDTIGTADWGGRLNLNLKLLEYNGSTDCTNEGGKKVWVEDGGTCALSLDNATTHDTTFSCTGNPPDGGGCNFEYTSKVFGHWKGNYEGVDAKLNAAGSFTAVCMAGVPHNVNLTLASANGQTTIADIVRIEVEGGDEHTGSAEAGGTVKGIPVKALKGYKAQKAVSVSREITITTVTTDATVWDRTYLMLTDYKLHLAVNAPSVVRQRSLTWSWNQNYNAFRIDEDGDPVDTAIRRGNTEKAQWYISTPGYKIMPYAGKLPPDQGYNPVGDPSHVPEIPGKNMERDALIYVPAAQGDEPFLISVQAMEPAVVALANVTVEETGIVEDFDATVEFDPLEGTALITSTVPFVLRLSLLGVDYGAGVVSLTRKGGMPAEESPMLEPYLGLLVPVVNRGFIVTEYEGWPAGDVASLAVEPQSAFPIEMAVGTTLGLTLETGDPDAPGRDIIVEGPPEGVVTVSAPSGLLDGESSAVIWFFAETPTSEAGESFHITLNGRTVEVTVRVTETETE
ncbi:MAG: hypothetical protein H6839_03715 [Planctomycetes bacterium]|nr:hypothetical protein [Planctomycetota bacterium]